MINSNRGEVEEVHALEGERGLPSVNDRPLSTAKRGIVLMGLLAIVAVAVMSGYWKIQQSAKDVDHDEQKPLQLTSAVPTRTFSAPPPDVSPPLPEIYSQIDARPIVLTQRQDVAGERPELPSSMNDRPRNVLDKAGSTLMVGSNAVEMTRNPSVETDSVVDPPTGTATSLARPNNASLTISAKMLGNRNFILAQGSFIDCALQTRLDSTLPGMTACVITRNIYSDNGKLLLVERGSTVSGEYKSNLRQGMARIYVLWTRIKTPNGVVINLDSPGTDPLGGSGLPGHIDTHFWQRFGGALMLSLIDDVARGITSESSNNSQFNFNGAGDVTQNMAAEALKNTINIPPTLYKNQGEQVGIYVAHDLDFSSVYDVASQ